MSIFAKNLKTFKTNITGTELTLKINVAVWLILDKEYGLPQGKWFEELGSNPVVTSAKFVASVLRANKYDVTLDEIMENVSEAELEKFIDTYNKTRVSDFEELFPTPTEEDGKQNDTEGK